MSKKEKTAPVKPTQKKVGNDNKKPVVKKAESTNWALRILVILLIFIAGAFTSLYFMPDLKERLPIVANWIGQDNSPALAAMSGQIAAHQAEIDTLRQKSLEQEDLLSQLFASSEAEIPADLIARIETLEQSLPSSAQVEPEDSSQSNRIDMLLSRMSQLEASFIPLSKNMINAAAAEKERQALSDENVSLSTKTDDLQSRLLAVETIAAKDNSGLLVNFKIAELKRKVVSGAIYDNELNVITSLVDSSSTISDARFNSSLDYLAEKSDSGIVTPDKLRNDFNALIPQLLSVSDVTPSASWWQNMLSGLGNLVTIRKTDGTSYNEAGLDGSISTIESLLGRGDFKAALDIIPLLPNDAQALLANWEADANRWTLSEQALSELEIIAAESYLGADAQ